MTVIITDLERNVDSVVEATETDVDDAQKLVEPLVVDTKIENDATTVTEKKDKNNKKGKYYKKRFYKKNNKDKRINSVASTTSADSVTKSNIENKTVDKDIEKKTPENLHKVVQDPEAVVVDNPNFETPTVNRNNRKKYFNRRNPFYGLNGRVIDGIMYPDNVPIIIPRNVAGPAPRYMQKNKGYIPVSSNFVPVGYDTPLTVRSNHSFRNNMNYKIPVNNAGYYKPKPKYYKPYGGAPQMNLPDYYYGPNPFPKTTYRKRQNQNSEKSTEEIKKDTVGMNENINENVNENVNKIETAIGNITSNENNVSSTSVNTIVA